MPTSTRFAVAVHILAGLAVYEGKPVASQVFAKSANTNAAVIRRIISMLHAAGLSYSQLGYGGGALLAVPPHKITLLDVYRATEQDTLLAMHRTNPSEHCAVGRHIQGALLKVFNTAEQAFERQLSCVTIADIARDITDRDPCVAPPKKRKPRKRLHRK